MSGSLYVRALEATPILASIEKLTFESLKEKINSFTGERAVTVVDQTSVYNIPATVMVNVDVPKQHARIVMKIDEAQVKPVDIVHFHNHPFSTIQHIHDLTPITLSPNKKMIRSQDELKEIKKSFGEVLGLHFTAQMR